MRPACRKFPSIAGTHAETICVESERRERLAGLNIYMNSTLVRTGNLIVSLSASSDDKATASDGGAVA
jgi:hypothetical protein